MGLKAGIPMPAADALTFEQYESLLGLPTWAQIEDEFVGEHEVIGVPGSETRAA